MKKILTTVLISFCTIYFSSAQFDDRFYFPSTEWKEIKNVQYEEIIYCIDSDSIHTLLFKPEKDPKATILFYHGAGGNISSYTFITDPLVKAGYQVFAIDFRGYGKSTGTPTHMNIASDAQFIFNDVLQNESINKLPIIVYGTSMGTQIATKIAKDNQTNISGLILDGTISSFTDMALLSVPEEQKPMIEQFVTSPYSAKSDIKEISNIPKLIIHSKEDRSVPFSQGLLVYENALEPKEFWEFEGGHLEAITTFPVLFIQKTNSILN